ncbi:MAG TPA: DMT family transporter [Burkholderiaceae bacterium]|nr:DMT family transporter [Burkholderiaceae bacterium]
MTPTVAHRWIRFAPWLFILIWASGYIAAKVAAPYAEPLTFLLVRYAGVIVLMGVLAGVSRAPWPSNPTNVMHIAIAGVGIQAGYLGGVWVAVKHGMPAGIVALIVNLQPVLTAVAGRAIGERLRFKQWCGLLLGFAGVALVVSTKLGNTQQMSPMSIVLAIGALLAITAGTLYQKKRCPHFDVRTGQVIQFVASFVVTLPFALATEHLHIEWTPQVIGAMAWSIFVLTGAGISLLFVMIRHGAATEVTSYLYLVPPVTALMAWAIFGETFNARAVLGMGLALIGVALVVRRSPVER